MNLNVTPRAFQWLALIIPLSLRLAVHADLTVQVVNDSGLPDSEVYAMLIGQPVTAGGAIGATGIAVANGSGTSGTAVESQAISTLSQAGFNVQSQFTGRSLPVHQFSVSSIASAAFVVSYRTNITYVNSNPSPITTNFRFDQCEFTFDPTIASVANLTSIDAYSVPMQLEVFPAGGGTTPLARRTYFTSTEGLIARFGALGCAGAFYGAGPAGSTAPVSWRPADGLTNFLRILGPGKISSTIASGSPAPFPSFSSYLSSLLSTPGGPYGFSVAGDANGSEYTYNGTVNSDGQGGYLIPLEGITTPAPPSPIPANAAVTVHLPNGSAPGAQQTVNFDSFIYGAVLDSSSFSVAGMSSSELTTNVNIVYGAIARDVLSALNFGYMNGRYGSSGTVWYGVPPTRIPFGAARPSNDGFYNPWAAVFYNESEAYGFAFSDRSGPSPAVTLQDGQTLRITILPDRRLDSPRVTVSATNDTSLVLRWPGVPGATGYEVEVLVPGRHSPETLPAGQTNVTHTISGLSPGTPYTFAVVATGEANGNPVRSPAIPLQASTTGTLVPVHSASGIPFNVSFSWSSDVPAGDTVAINGVVLTYNPDNQQWLNNGVNAAVTGIIGTNEYVLTVQDPAEGIIFANVIETTLTGSTDAFEVGLRRLVGNLQQLTTAGPPGSPPFTPTLPLTLGVPFVPQPTKAASAVRIPGVTYDQWLRQHPGLSDPDPEDDPDNDGAANALEYFRGSSPEVVDLRDFDHIAADDTAVLFAYRKSLLTLGVAERVQWSADLVRWTTEGITFDEDEDLGLAVRRTARLPRLDAGPVFLRYVLSGL